MVRSWRNVSEWNGLNAVGNKMRQRHTCGDKGHFARECPYGQRPKRKARRRTRNSCGIFRVSSKAGLQRVASPRTEAKDAREAVSSVFGLTTLLTLQKYVEEAKGTASRESFGGEPMERRMDSIRAWQGRRN